VSSTPVTTAGWLASGSTTSLSATSKIAQGPDPAISVSSGFDRAWLIALSDVAM
jgi:hypothetical protein